METGMAEKDIDAPRALDRLKTRLLRAAAVWLVLCLALAGALTWQRVQANRQDVLKQGSQRLQAFSDSVDTHFRALAALGQALAQQPALADYLLTQPVRINEVPTAELTERSVVRFACERRKTLVLADLTGAALKALGLNNDISASADYTASQAWARAIHGACPRWDGIRYVSRQMNKGFAYAIFERSGLRKLRAEKLKARQVDDLCDRFNVTAV